MRTVLIIVILFTVQAWQSSMAGTGWRQNTHLLPQYCKDRNLSAESPHNWKKWKKTFGSTFIHMHHYCQGVFAEYKFKGAIDKVQKDNWLREVTHQMEYVSKSCPAKNKCLLYPELHTRWAWALNKQGNIAQAIKHYQLAIQEKQDYIPAYTKLSKLYLKSDQAEEARKILELGLKANPNSRAIKRKLKKIETPPKSI